MPFSKKGAKRRWNAGTLALDGDLVNQFALRICDEAFEYFHG